MIHVHELGGCAPAPLAHYLKALGILRLVAEQRDGGARGWWEEDRFRLATKLTREEIEGFFLHDYQPTPLVSPWNRGAGFFFEKDPGISPLQNSTDFRFAEFRSGIKASRAQLDQLSESDGRIRDIKQEAKKIPGSDDNSARCRDAFEEDYKKLIFVRDQMQENRNRISECGLGEMERAEKRLKMAQSLVEDTEEYQELLDLRDVVRDVVEAEIRKTNDRDSANNRLKDVLYKLKSSNNYKRRLNDAERRFKRLKEDLIPNFRLNWRGAYREWMDAAMVLEDDGTPKYPALLGSGGNDGRLDFTNNFMKRLGEVFDLGSDDGRPKLSARTWISGSLWNQPIPGNLSGQPVGQYLPGTAGGANNSNGPDSNSMVNPVDFILTLEGAITFTSHASRRFGSSESSRAASPFVVNACGAAYASAATTDETARGEQWMPLWSHPLSYAELRRLLAEGRAQIGSRTARAVKRLGTARGIKAFQRYGYIERNGQSNLAVPLVRFEASEGHSESLACIDDLDTWLRRLRREARGPAEAAICRSRRRRTPPPGLPISPLCSPAEWIRTAP